MSKKYVIRYVESKDREAILELCARLYERISEVRLQRGETYVREEYVPTYIEEWIRESKKNVFLKAVVHESGYEHIVGICNLSFLNKHEAMLEAVRVEWEEQNKGIGTQLIKHCLREARTRIQHRILVRSLTDTNNLPTIRIMAKLGFRLVAPFIHMHGTTIKPQIKNQVQSIQSIPIIDIWNFVVNSTQMKAGRFLFPIGWRFRTFTDSDLANFAKHGQGIVYEKNNKLMGVTLWGLSKIRAEPTIEVPIFIAQEQKEVARALLFGLNTSINKLGIEKVQIYFPQDPWLVRTLRNEGFEESNHIDLVFERVVNPAKPF